MYAPVWKCPVCGAKHRSEEAAEVCEERDWERMMREGLRGERRRVMIYEAKVQPQGTRSGSRVVCE